jgi:hypothetical protein
MATVQPAGFWNFPPISKRYANPEDGSGRKVQAEKIEDCIQFLVVRVVLSKVGQILGNGGK